MNKIIATAVLLIILTGCSQMPITTHTGGQINHVVLIWLKDAGNPEQRHQIIEATRTLEQLPGIISVHVGAVIPSDRKVVDDSFDIGVHMLFSDHQSMEHYGNHPEHQRILNQIVMPLTERILIYDFAQ